MNPMMLINPWFNIICQVKTKHATVPKPKLFHQLNTPLDLVRQLGIPIQKRNQSRPGISWPTCCHSFQVWFNSWAEPNQEASILLFGIARDQSRAADNMYTYPSIHMHVHISAVDFWLSLNSHACSLHKYINIFESSPYTLKQTENKYPGASLYIDLSSHVWKIVKATNKQN